MKIFFGLLFLFFTAFSYAQSKLDNSDEEELANFKSILIDYEIHNNQLVAITKKKREYFIYFTDTKGAKLYETFDIFFATDLEIDCMGNLFVVGLDSAFQISISDYITRVQSLDLETYKSTISSCRALFEESLVRTSISNSLIYEPIDDSIYLQNPILSTIQVSSNVIIERPTKVETDTRGAVKTDQTLSHNRQLNLINDVLIRRPPTSTVYKTNNSRSMIEVFSELSAFQVGDSLWVFDETNGLILIYDESGKTCGYSYLEEYTSNYKLEQDRQTNDIYFITSNGGSRILQKVYRNGELEKGTVFDKALISSDIKISNDYIYFRDSNGIGESIKRVKLN